MASGTPIQTNLAIGILAQTGTNKERIPVITVEPAGKTSFVYRCMQTRLMGQYNGK